MVKYFEADSRMNWVDSNNVFVGFYNEQDCCEEWGGDFYSSLNEDAVIVNIDEDNDYVFDTSFYIEDFAWQEDIDKDVYDQDVYRAAFKLSNGKKDIFLVLWNEHNGYYAHGFNFCNGKTVIVEGYL